MKLIEWTLFCGENKHLVKGITFANPPGAMLPWSMDYIKNAPVEHIISVLGHFQIHSPMRATLTWVLANYGDKKYWPKIGDRWQAPGQGAWCVPFRGKPLIKDC